MVDSIYSFARFPALGNSLFLSLDFICWFLALLLALFLALNVSKIKSFLPMRPLFMFCKIEWFGRF